MPQCPSDWLQGPSTGWTDQNMRYLAAPFMVVFGGQDSITPCVICAACVSPSMFAGLALLSCALEQSQLLAPWLQQSSQQLQSCSDHSVMCWHVLLKCNYFHAT